MSQTLVFTNPYHLLVLPNVPCLFSVVIDGHVLMHGSPSMMLPELLHKVETELDFPVSTKSAQLVIRTPSPALFFSAT